MSEDFTSGDEFEFRSKDEAIEKGPAALGIVSGDKYYVGIKVKPSIYGPDAEEILERISQAAFDDDGEWVDDWLQNVKPKEEKELQDAFDLVWRRWLQAHPRHRPRWFNVEDWKTYTAP